MQVENQNTDLSLQIFKITAPTSDLFNPYFTRADSKSAKM